LIRGKKVDLVGISMEYLPLYMKWFNDPEVTDLLGDARYPFSEGKEREWIEQQLASKDSGRVFTVLTKNGRPIGNASFNEIDYHNRHAVLGIAIGEKGMWDKGFGEDIIRTLLKFAFEELGMHKVELGVHSANKRAIACYKKCGFILEGCEREHDFYKGKYFDALRMGILRKEWETIYRKEERARARK
jgi:RimJ/RimL family protein N-acetyltransferase